MKVFDWVCYGGMAVLIALLSWRNHSLATELHKTSVEAGPVVDIDQMVLTAPIGLRLPNLILSDLDTQPRPFPVSTNAPYTMYVVMHVGDCESCFLDARYWRAIEKDTQGLAVVVGILSAESPEHAAAFCKNWQLDFPVLYDPEAFVARALKMEDSAFTPVRVLADDDGTILSITRSFYGNPAKNTDYVQHILNLPHQGTNHETAD